MIEKNTNVKGSGLPTKRPLSMEQVLGVFMKKKMLRGVVHLLPVQATFRIVNIIPM